MHQPPRHHLEVDARGRRGVISELWGFLAQHRKWWLLPILMMLFLLGVLVATQGSALAPFLYALF
jgi:hypothetical protein